LAGVDIADRQPTLSNGSRRRAECRLTFGLL